ncbi:MAG: permease [Romboutsia sp.]|uniref:permease n=1 Tax=Romboutsia sp. TaxID=1965302 RepID=UPI003F2B06F5
MTSYILYGLCTILLIVSFIKDKEKTKLAFKNGFKSFENIMPQFLFIIIIVAIILSIVDPSAISNLIGPESGLLGISLSSIVGSITMMPTFVAFSTGDSLLKSGAGYAQVAALISTLTMVGVLTFSLESSYIGKKAAFYRNFIALLFAFVVAFFIGGVLG